ncbi:MAG: PEGA domain-containing protein [Deltaproteobacteria bacterium]|nr:PEGA domain-containing protein [Deltaproteobacteria bacterium]
MTSLLRRATLAAALTLTVTAAGTSSAAPTTKQDALASKQADARLNKGRTLFAKKAYNDARKEFAAAYELVPSGTAAYFAGRANEELGSFADAADWYRKALEGKLAPADHKDAQARLGALEKRPVTITIDSDPDGATVRVDGTEIAQKTPFFVRLTPGSHKVHAERDGKEVTQDIKVAPLHSGSLQIDFAKGTAAMSGSESKPPPVVAPEPTTPTTAPTTAPTTPESALPSTPESSGTPATTVPATTTAPVTTDTGATLRIVPTKRRVAYITAGAAVVALGFGAAYGLKSRGDERDAFPGERESIADRDSLITTVSLAAGAGLAITSVILWVTSPSSETVRTSTIAPMIGKGTGGVAWSLSF